MDSLVWKLHSQKVHSTPCSDAYYYGMHLESKCVHSAGFFDVAPNQQVVVSSDPSFSSLSFLEITANERLTPLDLTPPVYDQNVNSCCFNQESSVVAISVGDNSLHLWDVHTHADISHLRSEHAVHHLERSVQRDTWMGCMGSVLVEVDPRCNAATPYALSCPVNSFSQLLSSSVLAVSSFSSLFLFDLRWPMSPLSQVSLPSASPAISLSWSGNGSSLTANCGECGVARFSISPSGMLLQHVLPASSNTHYHREDAFLDDFLLVGSDSGVVQAYDAEARLLTQVSLGKSPVVSIRILQSFASSPQPLFLAATDTDISLLSFSPSLSPVITTLHEEEKPDVVALRDVDSDVDSDVEEWMLQGKQSDYARCSYDQFGACRQQVFVCRTCRDQYDRLLQLVHPEWSAHEIQQQFDVGVLCEQCAHFCHENKGHDVVALGVKNQIACDCGNTLFRRLDRLALLAMPSMSTPSTLPTLQSLPAEELPSFHSCSLCPEKECLNGPSCYNHNMRERWCYCDGVEELPMVQCVKCCDWFHNACAARRYKEEHGGTSLNLEDESVDFVCASCEEKERNGMDTMKVEEEEKEEEKDEVEEVDNLETLIREKRKKNDRTGAMKLMLRYMLEKSLKQSTESQRSIIVEHDIEKAKCEMEQVLKRVQKG